MAGVNFQGWFDAHEIVCHVHKLRLKSFIFFNCKTKVQNLSVGFGINIEAWA